MDKIISEIIIGAVILTLLVSVIPIYRSSAQLVRSAGEKMDENENIKEVTLGKLPAEGDFTSGRYLLELLDFCADRYRFLVSVKFSDKTYQFREENYAEAADVCDLLIRQSNGIIEEATGLYMDGELMGAVRSSADLNHLLSTILEEAVGEDTECEASFVQDIELVTGLFPTSSVITADEMKEILTENEQEKVSYTVKDGDTPITIAKEHGLTLDELNALNGGNVEDLMYAGTKLTLQREVPRLSVQITKTETHKVEIPYETITKKDSTQYTDYSKVTQEGKNGVEKRVDKVTYVNGEETSRETISSTVLKEPTDKVIVTGTKKRPLYTGPGESSGKFQWPTPSLNIMNIVGVVSIRLWIYRATVLTANLSSHRMEVRL